MNLQRLNLVLVLINLNKWVFIPVYSFGYLPAQQDKSQDVT